MTLKDKIQLQRYSMTQKYDVKWQKAPAKEFDDAKKNDVKRQKATAKVFDDRKKRR